MKRPHGEPTLDAVLQLIDEGRCYSATVQSLASMTASLFVPPDWSPSTESATHTFLAAYLYKFGRCGVQQDLRTAEFLFRDAITKHDHLMSKLFLGMLLRENRDYTGAREMFVAAEAAGCPLASFKLGLAYYHGGLLGVAKDYHLAAVHFAIGENLGDASSAEMLRKMLHAKSDVFRAAYIAPSWHQWRPVRHIHSLLPLSARKRLYALLLICHRFSVPRDIVYIIIRYVLSR